MRTYYPRMYEVTYLLGMLAGVLTKTDRVGYVAANPVYGIPAAVNAYAQGLKTVRPDAKVVLRWACLPDPAHPLDFSDRQDVEIFYARDNREPEGTHRDYGLVRRMPDGSLQPLGLPVWRWDTFYIEIVRSIFDGAWDSDAAGARAVNYWWGMRSGAEEIDYSKDLPAGTLQLLDLMEKMLSENNLRMPADQRQPFARPDIPTDVVRAGACAALAGGRGLQSQGIDGDGLAGRMRGRCAAALR